MNYRPGDVTERGNIFTRDGRFLAAGSANVTLCQALKAYKFGWRIRNAVLRRDGKMYFVVERRYA